MRFAVNSGQNRITIDQRKFHTKRNGRWDFVVYDLNVIKCIIFYSVFFAFSAKMRWRWLCMTSKRMRKSWPMVRKLKRPVEFYCWESIIPLDFGNLPGWSSRSTSDRVTSMGRLQRRSWRMQNPSRGFNAKRLQRHWVDDEMQLTDLWLLSREKAPHKLIYLHLKIIKWNN